MNERPRTPNWGLVLLAALVVAGNVTLAALGLREGDSSVVVAPPLTEEIGPSPRLATIDIVVAETGPIPRAVAQSNIPGDPIIDPPIPMPMPKRLTRDDFQRSFPGYYDDENPWNEHEQYRKFAKLSMDGVKPVYEDGFITGFNWTYDQTSDWDESQRTEIEGSLRSWLKLYLSRQKISDTDLLLARTNFQGKVAAPPADRWKNGELLVIIIETEALRRQKPAWDNIIGTMLSDPNLTLANGAIHLLDNEGLRAWEKGGTMPERRALLPDKELSTINGRLLTMLNTMTPPSTIVTPRRVILWPSLREVANLEDKVSRTAFSQKGLFILIGPNKDAENLDVAFPNFGRINLAGNAASIEEVPGNIAHYLRKKGPK